MAGPELFSDLLYNSLGVKVSTTGKIFELFLCCFHLNTFFFVGVEGGGSGGGNKHTSKPERENRPGEQVAPPVGPSLGETCHLSARRTRSTSKAE